MKENIILCLCLVFSILLILTNCQTSSSSKKETGEDVALDCMDQFIKDNGGDWNAMFDYFHEYLKVSHIQEEDMSLAEGYREFLDLRSVQPPQKPPYLQNRDKIMVMLINAKVLTPNNVIGNPFFECFYQNRKHYEGLEQSSALKAAMAIAKDLEEKKMPGNPPAVIGRLNKSITNSDLENEMVKKIVFLLAFADVPYLEEYYDGETNQNNPIIRQMLKRKAEQGDGHEGHNH